MSIIVRYILRELGATFLFGFVAFTLLLLMGGVIKRALEMHMPLIWAVQLIPGVFAEISRISLPVTLLLAVTTFFARMSGNNEVTALKALGISPTAFLMPVFVIAFIISIIGVGINELAVTWGRESINAIAYRSAEDTLIGQLKTTHRFDTDNQQITILVKGVDGQRRLIEPKIMLQKESVTIEARAAQISIDFNTNILTVNFDDIRMTSGGGLKILAGDKTLSIPLSDIVPTDKSNSPSGMSLSQIHEEKKKAAEQIERQRRIIAAQKTFAASMGLIDDWAMSRQINESKATIRSLQSHQNRLSVEPPRRWATGFCCFFFVWLGVPLAIWMKKSDFFASFFACFVPILILYYPLLAFGQSQAKSGSLPPMCVWTANVAIGLVGLWFLRQIHRY
jgi:lipopolysaccharide export system permease protein